MLKICRILKLPVKNLNVFLGLDQMKNPGKSLYILEDFSEYLTKPFHNVCTQKILPHR